MSSSPLLFTRRFIGRCLAILPVHVILSSACFAQIGDKPGEEQKPLVPPDQIPPAPPLSPEEALKTFALAPGFRIELAAAEPQVQEPVVAAFGPDGRMWVAEMRGYMPDLDGNGEDEPTGRVVVLNDADGDGFYEESKVFVDGLVLPRAILPLPDGVLIGAPPELAFYRDTDGDGKADHKEIIASDYGVKVDPRRPHLANPERAPNSLFWAFDNWIYSTAYTRKFRYTNGRWQMGTTSFRGQWGLAQDDRGYLYHGSNSDHIRVDVIHSSYLARNPNYPSLAGTNVNAAADQSVWPARVTPGINRGYRPEMLRNGRLKDFTAAGGQWIYGGDLLPGLRGNYFIPEPAAHLVRRSVLDYQDGTVRSKNAYDEQEFLTSTDERFRPVNVTTGPDGALYIVDFYRGILQHRISLTSYLRNQIKDRDLDQHLHRGRIYRITPDGKTATAPQQLTTLTIGQWVERLSHPNHWWREQAQRMLVTRADSSTIPAIRRMAVEGNRMARIHALWTLEGIGGDALDIPTLTAALGTTDPVIRTHAVRLAEPFLKTENRGRILPFFPSLLAGGSPGVQLQAILAIGELKDPEWDYKLAFVVRNHPGNIHLLDAFLSGLADREFALLDKLIATSSWEASNAFGNRILGSLARGAMGSRNAGHVKKILEMASTAVISGQHQRGLALLDGLTPVSGSSRRPLSIDSEPAGWNALAGHEAAKKKTGALANVIVWPGKPGVTAAIKPAPMSSEQQRRFDAGKDLYATICAACHQADGRGLDGLAPPLLDSEWVLGPPGRSIRIVLQGVRGPIRVLGKMHTGDMPPMQEVLDDEQISSILTYLRREWGHTSSPVDPKEVAAVRKATAGHHDAWSPEELMQIK